MSGHWWSRQYNMAHLEVGMIYSQSASSTQKVIDEFEVSNARRNVEEAPSIVVKLANHVLQVTLWNVVNEGCVAFHGGRRSFSNRHLDPIALLDWNCLDGMSVCGASRAPDAHMARSAHIMESRQDRGICKVAVTRNPRRPN